MTCLLVVYRRLQGGNGAPHKPTLRENEEAGMVEL